jgi:hypothetical protein
VSKTHVSPADCVAGPFGLTNYAGYNGAMLPSVVDGDSTITVVSNQGKAGITYIFASSGFGSTVDGTTGTSKTFRTPDNSGVFIYAGPNYQTGALPGPELAMQFCQTSYGWLLQIDTGDNKYSTLVTYVLG